MKLAEIKYERPSVAEVCAELRELTARFSHAADAASAISLADELNRVRNHALAMALIARFRFDGDVRSEFYRVECDWWDEYLPVLEGSFADFQRAYIASSFVKELDAHYGAATSGVYSQLASTYSDAVLPLLQEENALISKYDRLIASAQIEFDGKMLPIDDFWGLMEEPDRVDRKRATDAFFGFYEANSGEIEAVYDDMVKLRTRIARELGFPSFTELAYARLCRAFAPSEAKKFRDAVCAYVVPAATRENTRRASRLGLDGGIRYYDACASFPSGSPKPVESLDEQLRLAKRMYHELSPETGEFIDAMCDREAFDLPTRLGKAAGAYCDLLPEYGWPFVFANSNGSSEDIATLTHELGHAFQLFRTVKNPIMPECVFPANDACEIHSTAMEYLTWPWMELFFKDGVTKLKYMQLSGSLCALPYQSAVDEFQEAVYASPDMTPVQRRALWQELDRKYQPWLDYSELPFLMSGGYWLRQGHIFSSPFYYLDYSIAFVCAIQLWLDSQSNAEDAFSRYLAICDIGGRGTLYDIVEAAEIGSPFDEAVIWRVVESVTRWLSRVDEAELL